MKVEVSAAIEELKRQFNGASLSAREDGQGGAYILLEPIDLSQKFTPATTWIGFQIPAQYPYADIYPIFIGSDVRRVDGIAFQPPVTLGHNFEGRPAIQISRRNAAAQSGSQKAVAKTLKVLDFLERLQ
jgi:hypothetical protein